MLSALQRRVASLVLSLPEAEGFVLAGGGALILQGYVDRRTQDVDLFTTERERVDVLVPAAERALAEAGLDVERVRVAPGFARLQVRGGGEETGLDLANDARIRAPLRSEVGPVLSAEELAVDKVLALFDRAEPRDFVDLFALEPGFGLAQLCDLALDKDRGFQPSVLAVMLGRFVVLRRSEFDLDDPSYERLASAVERWKRELVLLSR